jgi:lactate dehydrogenase-like 2-hydroxyacid dehydrogenase
VPRPRVHEAAGVPAEIEADLADAFELAASPGGADGVVVTPAVAVDAAFLDAVGPQLRIVANYAVGVDNLDLDAIRERGVVASNTPGVLTNATAEHAIALALALLRRIVEGDRSLRRRDPWEWGPDFMVGEGLEGKELLVIGPGRIGRRVAELAEAHGARAVFAGRGDDLLDALSSADVVTLHCPLTPDTRHLIDAAALAAMKPTAVLVNTARGPVVDEGALVAVLGPARSPEPRSTSSSTSLRSRRSCWEWKTSSSHHTSRARPARRGWRWGDSWSRRCGPCCSKDACRTTRCSVRRCVASAASR